MQRKHQHLVLSSKLLAFSGRAPYLGCPRQEHKHVASVLFKQKFLQGHGHLFFQRLRGIRLMGNRQFKETAFRA